MEKIVKTISLLMYNHVVLNPAYAIKELERKGIEIPFAEDDKEMLKNYTVDLSHSLIIHQDLPVLIQK